MSDSESTKKPSTYDPPRDAAYLAKGLKTPGMRHVRADERFPVRRAFYFPGTYVDVNCVEEVGVATTHPGDAACQSGGSCSSRCRNDNVIIRYEDKGVTKFQSVNVKDEDLIPELIARIVREVDHGTSTVIDPEKMLRALQEETILRMEAEREPASVKASLDASQSRRGTPSRDISRWEAARVIAALSSALANDSSDVIDLGEILAGGAVS